MREKKLDSLVPMRISVSQEQAERVCRGLGGRLAEIQSRAEQGALGDHYRRETEAPGGGGNLVTSIMHRLASLARRQTAWWTGGRYGDQGWAWPVSGQK